MNAKSRVVKDLDRRTGEFDEEFAAFAKADEDGLALLSIPGVGVSIASALIAAIGRGESFAKARDLAAWLGLAPRLLLLRGGAVTEEMANVISRTGTSCIASLKRLAVASHS